MACEGLRTCVNPGNFCPDNKFDLGACAALPLDLRFNPGSFLAGIPNVPPVLEQIFTLICPSDTETGVVISASSGQSLYRTNDPIFNQRFRARLFLFQADIAGLYKITLSNNTFSPYITASRNFATSWRVSGTELMFVVGIEQTGPITVEVSTLNPQTFGSFDITLDCNPTSVCSAVNGISITSSVTSGVGPLTVNFTATLTPDNSVVLNPLDYIWTFGDGQTGSGKMVTHVYHGFCPVTRMARCTVCGFTSNTITISVTQTGSFTIAGWDLPSYVIFTSFGFPPPPLPGVLVWNGVDGWVFTSSTPGYPSYIAHASLNCLMQFSLSLEESNAPTTPMVWARCNFGSIPGSGMLFDPDPTSTNFFFPPGWNGDSINII
jgi:PKD repeat protein